MSSQSINIRDGTGGEYVVKKKKKTKRQHGSKKKEAHEQTRFGDADFVLETIELFADNANDSASFKEICFACCYNTQREWVGIILSVIALVGSLYFFLLGLELLGTSVKVLMGCGAARLFSFHNNPVTNLMVGILTTSFLQSSGTVTAVIVSLEEAGVLTVDAGIYIVMGANVGTSVTASLVSLARVRNTGELERGFSVASLHSLFNIMTVAVLFPLECSTGYLKKLTGLVVDGAETGQHRQTFVGPIKHIVTPLVNRILMSNKEIIKEVAAGSSCETFYPIECDQGVVPSYETCHTGLISCDKTSGLCPSFFNEDATVADDQISGCICVVISVILLAVTISSMHFFIGKLLFGLSIRVVHAVTRCNGYFGIAIGIGVTILVQSSSVVTSVLVPFGSVGVLPMEHIYPLVLGANAGTALNAVIHSMSAYGEAPLQVALSHLFFNLSGLLLFYPTPHFRRLALLAARRLGSGAKIWRMIPFLWIFSIFFVLPVIFFGLAAMFLDGRKGLLAGAIVICVVAIVAILRTFYWCKYQGGDQQFVDLTSRCSKKEVDHRSFEDEEEHMILSPVPSSRSMHDSWKEAIEHMEAQTIDLAKQFSERSLKVQD